MINIKEKKPVFMWGKEFETDISRIDTEHRYLIEIINKIGDLLSSSSIDTVKINDIFKDLLDYTKYHFSNEEMLAKEYGVDQRHMALHKNEHRNFIQKITELYSALNPENIKFEAKELLDFLVHWLTFHILGMDKNLASQMKLIKSGKTPQEAFDAVNNSQSEQVDTLVKSFNNIFDILIKYNEELLGLKTSLEQKVKERTAELEVANEKLRQIALNDELTKLANRRSTMNELDRYIDKFNKNGDIFSIIMLDLNDFKRINDTLGHDAGDRLLIKIAQAIKDGVRTDDIACRLGGDEFIIICPNTDKDGAKNVAGKILQSINEIKVQLPNQIWHANSSIGIATISNELSDKMEILKAADAKMYKNKQS
ncbi:GGDEF domain-containing protein [Campylobacter sp. 19-13652]|uniref:GGDEF domain-containing protein n=1 Tax=Campylobacter sp. 19-13652 TaxID=2840180 RepID=UPI001C7944EF|nr:GGDEF domain-containing protein [Campylobacter sp. 19-13652]BCX79582.1 GGDEF domain-containing protein [Campylobacter sp. 19-13652]